MQEDERGGEMLISMTVQLGLILGLSIVFLLLLIKMIIYERKYNSPNHKEVKIK